MISDVEVCCPFCGEDIMVKVLSISYHRDTYLVENSCKKCGVKASKIETALNKKGGKRFTLETSSLKIKKIA